MLFWSVNGGDGGSKSGRPATAIGALYRFEQRLKNQDNGLIRNPSWAFYALETAIVPCDVVTSADEVIALVTA